MTLETLAYISLIIFILYISNKSYTTPEQLEKRHREILNNAENKFASKIAYDNLKRNISNNPKKRRYYTPEAKEREIEFDSNSFSPCYNNPEFIKI